MGINMITKTPNVNNSRSNKISKSFKPKSPKPNSLKNMNKFFQRQTSLKEQLEKLDEKYFTIEDEGVSVTDGQNIVYSCFGEKFSRVRSFRENLKYDKRKQY